MENSARLDEALEHCIKHNEAHQRFPWICGLVGDTSKEWVDKGLRGQRSAGCERALRRPSWLYSWKEFRPELGLLYWEWKENGRNCKPGFMFALQHPYSHPFPLLHSPSQLMIPSSFIGNSSPNHWVGLYTSMYLCVSWSPSFLLLGCKNSPYRRSAPPLCSSNGFLFFMIPWSCIISLSLFNIHLSVLFDSPCLLKFQVMLRFSLPITSFIVKLLQSIVYTYCFHFFVYKLLFSLLQSGSWYCFAKITLHSLSS